MLDLHSMQSFRKTLAPRWPTNTLISDYDHSKHDLKITKPNRIGKQDGTRIRPSVIVHVAKRTMVIARQSTTRLGTRHSLVTRPGIRVRAWENPIRGHISKEQVVTMVISRGVSVDRKTKCTAMMGVSVMLAIMIVKDGKLKGTARSEIVSSLCN